MDRDMMRLLFFATALFFHWRWQLITRSILIGSLLTGLGFFALQCGSETPADYPYICENGIAANGFSLEENSEKCTFCRRGYELVDEICQERESNPGEDESEDTNPTGDEPEDTNPEENEPEESYPYLCENGEAADGFSALADSQKCASCDSNYILYGELCELDGDGDRIADRDDSFPADACAFKDSDDDGYADEVYIPREVNSPAACQTASTLNTDIDDDNNGLIEIASLTDLENIRYNLAGSSFDDEAADTGTDPLTGMVADTGDRSGSPTEATDNCDTNVGNTLNPAYLCGYELKNSINMEGSAAPWTPIGYDAADGSNSAFTAIFEGNGYTLFNLYIRAVEETPIDLPDHLGLFADLNGATVRNVIINTMDIQAMFSAGSKPTTGDENNIGALAAIAQGSVLIQNVVMQDADEEIDLQGATTDDNQYIGGLVGEKRNGTITASQAEGTISGDAGDSDQVGGLVGLQSGGKIVASWASGNIYGGGGNTDYIGGLLGRQSGGSTVASWATADVSSGGGFTDRSGGLIGWLTGGKIVASWASGRVSGGGGLTDYVGGLAGQQGANSQIVSSWASGDVEGGEGGIDYVGGLVGRQSGGDVIASWSSSNVDGGGGDTDNAGALIGYQRSGSFVIASYGFGAFSGETINTIGGDGSSSSPWPLGITGLTDLTASNTPDSWSADVWDFGSGTERPALKYVDDYTFDNGGTDSDFDDDTHSYSCSAASFLSIEVSCGITFLPGQDR